MTTLYLLDDAYKIPYVAAPLETEAFTVWINNPRALEEMAFNHVPAGVMPHDHSERRGDLLREPFWAQSLGPFAPTGGASTSWVQGLPLYPPFVGWDFTLTPKCLGVWPFRIPAQVKSFNLEFLIYLDGATPRTVFLKAIVRPHYEHGLDYVHGSGPNATVTVSQVAGIARVTRDQFQFTNLTSLGDAGLDREDLVLEIWLLSNAPAGCLYRLLAGAAYPTLVAAVAAGEPVEPSPSRAEVLPTEIKPSEFVYSDIAQRAHLRYNQTILEVLGRAPGLENDLNTENETDPYQSTIYAPHQHRGRRFTDPVTGLARYDGAVTKRILWQCAPIANYTADDAANATDTPGDGITIHAGGTLATQAELQGRLSLPKGLGAILVRFAMLPGTSLALSRLTFYVKLEDIEGNDIAINVNSQGLTQQQVKSSNFTLVDVLPVENPSWQSNQIRISNGLGLWTSDAKKLPALTGGIVATRLPRISRLVTLSFSLTKVDYPYVLRCKWALETGAKGSAVYAGGARLAFVQALVPAGY